MTRLQRLPLLVCLFLSLLLSSPFIFSADARSVVQQPAELNEGRFASISGIVEDEIRSGRIPGAVILIGNAEKVLYRRAFGFRAVEPETAAMTADTIFDLASLTKVVATTTAVMQLAEEGRLRIDEPVTTYWPAFRTKGKDRITVRHLLTHYSGLRADLKLRPAWFGYDVTLKKILAEKTLYPPGSRFLYSDLNFIVLGELVQRISGKPFDRYCSEYIFTPLGMKDTCFKPSSLQVPLIAPTQYRFGSRGKMLQGEVHDPTCQNMNGIAGHAGLFSTADDLSVFARMILKKGSSGGTRILSRQSVEVMTSPQSPPHMRALRGFGWDISSPYAKNIGEHFSKSSFGHKGYTGTSLWIDPESGVYVIILTNRVHPNGKGNVEPLRARVSSAVAGEVKQAPEEYAVYASLETAMNGRYRDSSDSQQGSIRRVQTGIDVLDEEKFHRLTGLRVGLITNHSGLNGAGRRTVDLLYSAPDVSLRAIFSPEHGLSGTLDRKVETTTDSVTGLPVYSLYGSVKRPTEQMLEDLDALVFDIQDAGVRFYTYITTMAYAMEAAAQRGIAFYVLDRPNPITGLRVQGPVMEKDLKSFTGYFPLPVRHGMTVGELARMFNEESRIGVALHVIKMQGYRRSDWFDETGLKWINPSPNLRSLDAAALYPGVALVEGANVSVGRGTDNPFEIFGAPWINAKRLTAYLSKRAIRGVAFTSVKFVPRSSLYKNQSCSGVRINLVDRDILDPVALGIEIIGALRKLHPKEFQIDKTLHLVGSRQTLDLLKKGADPYSVVMNWQDSLEQFHQVRSKYLLY